PPGYQTMKLVDARSAAGRAMLAEVASHGQRLNDGGDFPEMVEAGLIHALDDAHFEGLTKARRLVVLIGDHGNREPLDYKSLVPKFERPGGARIELLAIQVV